MINWNERRVSEEREKDWKSTTRAVDSGGAGDHMKTILHSLYSVLAPDNHCDQRHNHHT